MRHPSARLLFSGGLVLLAACSGGDSGDRDNEGGAGADTGGAAGNPGGSGGVGGDGSGGQPQGDGGETGEGGATREGGASNQGGEGGTPAAVPYLTRAPSTEGWGAGFTVKVPAGVVLQPGGTQYLTAPKLATPALPAGTGVSRTMALLKGSTAQKRNLVKILFYGQSITRQDWFQTVTNDLKAAYPHADIQMWMLASGGQSAAKMRRASEHDVIPLYPDLIVYQNYGDQKDVNAIIADWRARTTAEILVQNWHLGSDAGNGGVERMSYLFIPEIARRLGAEFLDVRTIFRDFLTANNLPNAGLTSDGIHLNDQGNQLMAKAHVDLLSGARTAAPVDPLAMVQTFEVGKDLRWNGGALAFEFDGNRVDLIASPGASIAAGAATVTVDGKKPSEFAGNFAFTRPNGNGNNVDKPEPGWPWSPGAPMRIDSNAARGAEDWTLRIMNRNGFRFDFTVEGSVTGADGMGSSDAKFTSRSGRVVIDPADWATRSPSEQWNIPNNEVRWKAVALSADVYPREAVNASDATREFATTLFQGVPNARHKVVITSRDGKPLPVAAVRLYRPPLLSP
jgi:hypothetical protein